MADPQEIRVQDEQGNIHVFPSGTTPEMIAGVLNVKPPSPPPNAGLAPPAGPSMKMDSGEGPIAAGMTSFESQISRLPKALFQMSPLGIFTKEGKQRFDQDMAESNAAMNEPGILPAVKQTLSSLNRKFNPIVKTDAGTPNQQTDWGATAANLLPLIVDLKGRGITESPAGDLVKSTPAIVKATTGVIRRGTGYIDPTVMTAEESATRALKPRNSLVDWKKNVGSALPDVRRAVDSLGVDPAQATFDDVQAATLRAKKDVWGELEKNFLGPNARLHIDTSPIARTIRSTISQRTLEQNPGLAESINKIADTYENRTLAVADLEERIQELNRETRGIEARYPNDKAAAKAMPENAPIFAERQALSNLLGSTLDEASGPGAAALKQRYGALKQFSDVLDRRKNVYERQNPESLAEQAGNIVGLGQMARGAGRVMGGDVVGGGADIVGGVVARKVARAGKNLNDSQFLLRQALSKTSARPPMVPRITPEYIPPGQPLGLPSGATKALPAGVYAQPSGVETPLSPALPPFGIKGFLPRGVYEQPGTSINQPALPPYRGIPLPETFKKGPVSRYTRAEGESR